MKKYNKKLIKTRKLNRKKNKRNIGIYYLIGTNFIIININNLGNEALFWITKKEYLYLNKNQMKRYKFRRIYKF